MRVSRWMWWAWHGPIPPDLVVMHACDLPICTRLECLQLGTQAANLLMAAGRDRVARRGVGGRQDVADRRGQAAQSRAVRDAVRAAVAAGVTDLDQLDAVVRAVVFAGSPHQDQLPLFDIDPST